MRIIESFGPEDTYALGEKIGREAGRGEVYSLIGDLGVGKTVFTQGLAAGLGIKEAVNSPTFTIVQIYEEGRLPFYHFDVYRLKSSDEIFELGFDEYLFGSGVCLIEWADIVKDAIPENAIWISIEKDLSKGENYRSIKIDE